MPLDKNNLSKVKCSQKQRNNNILEVLNSTYDVLQHK